MAEPRTVVRRLRHLRRIVRQPGLHFLLAGGALFLLRTGLAVPNVPATSGPAPMAPPPKATPAVTSPAVTVPPSASRPAALTDDDLLYREALRLGLDREKSVERRLVQNMRFLEIAPTASDRALYRQAVDIGFNRTDPVVRRFLVEQMRLFAQSGSGPDVFTEAELAGYLERHPEPFMVPAFVRLTHVFLSEDRRGAAMEADARRLLARLRAERISPEAAPKLGDPFLLGHHTVLRSRSDLEQIYGPGMATEVMRLPVGAWSGPVRSEQGMHLVWIHESRQKKPAQLADVRSRIALLLAQERREARLADYLRRLRHQATEPAETASKESSR